MAKRNNEPPVDAPPTGEDSPTSAPEVTVVEAPPPADERFRVETSVYYVPHLGFGAVFVPGGTIVSRASHDLQKLIAQGAKLRPAP